METKKGNNVYQMVTDRVIEQMKKGIIPWQRPWTGTAGTINYVTRKPYSLLNQMLLGRNGEWITFKQLKERGGSIKKGAKAGIVVFYGKYTYTKEEKEDGQEAIVVKEHTIPVLRYYNVFHIDDCTGIDSKLESKPAAVATEPIENAEDIINGYVEREEGLTFKNDEPSNRAFYRPSDDLVVVPMLSQYTVTEEYYSTAFHELTHSTMAEWRCIIFTVRALDNVKMASFPYHALDSYLPRLIRAGRRIAICDQLEDPRLTKKLVKRGVSELTELRAQ